MMEKCNYRKDPHQDIDHVFRDLLPAHGMVERPAQVELSRPAEPAPADLHLQHRTPGCDHPRLPSVPLQSHDG